MKIEVMLLTRCCSKTTMLSLVLQGIGWEFSGVRAIWLAGRVRQHLISVRHTYARTCNCEEGKTSHTFRDGRDPAEKQRVFVPMA